MVIVIHSNRNESKTKIYCIIYIYIGDSVKGSKVYVTSMIICDISLMMFDERNVRSGHRCADE